MGTTNATDQQPTSTDNNTGRRAKRDTQPRPHETLAEVSERWRIAQETDVDPETGLPMRIPATSTRPTRNIRRPLAAAPLVARTRSHDVTAVLDVVCSCSQAVAS